MTEIHTIAIEVHGDTGHGSRPDDIKRHAIYESFRIIKSVRDFSRTLGVREDAISIRLLSTGSGNSANQFPGTCRVEIDALIDDASTVEKIKEYSQKIST